jgi:hypothetical protein
MGPKLTPTGAGRGVPGFMPVGHRDKNTTERIYVHAFDRKEKAEALRAAMQSAMNRTQLR